jgi:hypothetical protein
MSASCSDADHAAIKADDESWYAQPFRYVDHFAGDDEVPACDTEVRECSCCGSHLGRVMPAEPLSASRYGIGAPRGEQPDPRTHRPFEARNATTKLPDGWRPTVAVPRPTGSPEPAPSKAMRAEARMQTEILPVVGRAGSREWARNAAPIFGGGECR